MVEVDRMSYSIPNTGDILTNISLSISKSPDLLGKKLKPKV